MRVVIVSGPLWLTPFLSGVRRRTIVFPQPDHCDSSTDSGNVNPPTLEKRASYNKPVKHLSRSFIQVSRPPPGWESVLPPDPHRGGGYTVKLEKLGKGGI